MASNNIKQPVRARKLETGKTYYPDELVEKDGELYVYSSDGSTSIRVNKSVKLLNSTKTTIGTVDPIAGTDVTIPDATTTALGLVKFSTTAPKAGAANASVGSEAAVARADHVHPIQTSVSGNAGTADKLKTARSIGISGGITATAATFDGTKDVSITVTGVPASIVSGLGTVATSNSYNDLDNKPTIYGLAGTADIPKENGTAAVGTLTRSARADHVHPLQTSVETADKLSTSTAGNAATPVYFVNGIPTALKYTIETSVPANAKFTDTVYTHPTHTAKTSGLYKITVDSFGHVSATTAVVKSDITGLGIASDSVMTAATSSAAGAKGLVPAPAAGANSKFLRGDGTWAVPTNTDTKVNVTLGTTTKAYLLGTSSTPTSTATGVTTIADTEVYLDTTAGQLVATKFKGALTGNADSATKATQDSAGNQINTTYIKNLSVNGTTITITKGDDSTSTITTKDSTYSVMGAASTSTAGTAGLVPASKAGDQAKFLRADGTWVVPTDTVYIHPTHTAKASGMYKITVDSLGHISAATAITKADITGLGIASDSVMGAATISAAGTKGLVPAPAAGANTKFLRGDGTWQTIDTGTIVSGSTTATAGASVITNPLSVAISDAAQIYQNGILLTKNTHYTINAAGNIALNGYTAEDGDIFTVVSKSTGTDVALTAAAANVTIQDKNSYFGGATSVESALSLIGGQLNGGVVSGVRVNGTIATPDSNGVVDVASPTIQVNGTTVTPSTTGVVNITNVVKTTGATMTGDLIASSNSSGNHVRNISIHSSTAALPTNGNAGDIILVYADS